MKINLSFLLFLSCWFILCTVNGERNFKHDPSLSNSTKDAVDTKAATRQDISYNLDFIKQNGSSTVMYSQGKCCEILSCDFCPLSVNMIRKQCFLVCPPSENMARKQCFLVCPPLENMARKQYVLVCLSSVNMTRKQCFLVCHLTFWRW